MVKLRQGRDCHLTFHTVVDLASNPAQSLADWKSAAIFGPRLLNTNVPSVIISADILHHKNEQL